MENKGEILIYQAQDSSVELVVQLDKETVWLTQAQMTTLFERDRTVITKHIGNIFKEAELDEKSNVHFLHIANSIRLLSRSTHSAVHLVTTPSAAAIDHHELAYFSGERTNLASLYVCHHT